MQPKMIIVAGPPGSGKSTAFPVKDFGLDYFNADDRAAELNGGSYQGISPAIRNVVNKEYEQFVLKHIQSKKSFAIETEKYFLLVTCYPSTGKRFPTRALPHLSQETTQVMPDSSSGGAPRHLPLNDKIVRISTLRHGWPTLTCSNLLSCSYGSRQQSLPA